jgi:hypothetical protein
VNIGNNLIFPPYMGNVFREISPDTNFTKIFQKETTMKGTKQSFIRVNHIKDITPLQEAMINVFIETTHPNLTERSKQTYKTDLRRFLLSSKAKTNLENLFVQWLNENRILLVERKVTPHDIEELKYLLGKLFDLSSSDQLVDEYEKKIYCTWDSGNAEVDDNLKDYTAFTISIDDDTEIEFNILFTKDRILNGSKEDISLQDVKDFIQNFKVIEINPVWDYL